MGFQLSVISYQLSVINYQLSSDCVDILSSRNARYQLISVISVLSNFYDFYQNLNVALFKVAHLCQYLKALCDKLINVIDN